MYLIEGENGAKGWLRNGRRVTSYLLSITSAAASGKKYDRLEDQSSQAIEGDGYRPSAFIR